MTGNQQAQPVEEQTNVQNREQQGSLLAAPARELAARTAATRLRNTLRLNAAFSTVTGLTAAAAGGLIADAFGVEQAWLIHAVGIGLLGFAASLVVTAGRRTSAVVMESALISAADLGWVVGTAVIVAFGWLSTAGVVVMGLVALAVFDLALLQLRARHRLVRALADIGDRSSVDEFPPIEVVTASRRLDVPVDRLWPIMTDHSLYAKLALNLSAAEGLTPNGPGFRRSCTDTSGRSWSETCTLWQPGRRYDIAVDTTPADYPYPLQTLHGSWAADPVPAIGTGTDEQSDVSMAFALQPTAGLRGRLFVPAMQLAFPPVLRRILTGWRRAAADRR